jgi:hypothetical protein
VQRTKPELDLVTQEVSREQMPAEPRVRKTQAHTPQRTTVDFYADAEIYDILHASGTSRDASGLDAIERRFLGEPAANAGPRVWLEPACGSGRYLIAGAKLGRRCFGFDIEPGMVQYAEESFSKLPSGIMRPQAFVARMEDFDQTPQGKRLPPVHLAFNLINTIRHLRDDDAMHLHLAAVARALAPEGIYVVGLHLCAYGQEPIVEDIWKGKRGTREVTQVVQYIPATGPRGETARAERVVSHLTITRTRRDGTTEESHRDSVYTLRGYSLTQWRKIVAGSGLRELASVTESGEDNPPREGGYAIFVLGK